MNGILIEDVRRNYAKDVYTNRMKYPARKKYPDKYVFDDTKSVQWNNEKVVIENENLKKYREIYVAYTEELNEKLKNDCIYALMNQFKISNKQAEIVYEYGSREYNSSDFDMLCYFEKGMFVDVLKNA